MTVCDFHGLVIKGIVISALLSLGIVTLGKPAAMLEDAQAELGKDQVGWN